LTQNKMFDVGKSVMFISRWIKKLLKEILCAGYFLLYMMTNSRVAWENYSMWYLWAFWTHGGANLMKCRNKFRAHILTF
jgi:hypothetical protein